MSVRLLTGDCRDILKTLDAGSVHCCVTSPPYFGLRDYGMAEQIGLEPTPDAFVAKLVDVFRKVRRVLRDDGTLWLNLGDGAGTTGLVADRIQRNAVLIELNPAYIGIADRRIVGDAPLFAEVTA